MLFYDQFIYFSDCFITSFVVNSSSKLNTWYFKEFDEVSRTLRVNDSSPFPSRDEHRILMCISLREWGRIIDAQCAYIKQTGEISNFISIVKYLSKIYMGDYYRLQFYRILFRTVVQCQEQYRFLTYVILLA